MAGQAYLRRRGGEGARRQPHPLFHAAVRDIAMTETGRVAATLDYVFEMRVDFRPERCSFGPLPGGGFQGYTPCAGGTIYGPRLSGHVVPDSGADYADVRADGTIVINSHYLLET